MICYLCVCDDREKARSLTWRGQKRKHVGRILMGANDDDRIFGLGARCRQAGDDGVLAPFVLEFSHFDVEHGMASDDVVDTTQKPELRFSTGLTPTIDQCDQSA